MLNTCPLAKGWPVTPAVLASSGETVRHLALRVAALVDFIATRLAGGVLDASPAPTMVR